LPAELFGKRRAEASIIKAFMHVKNKRSCKPSATYRLLKYNLRLVISSFKLDYIIVSPQITNNKRKKFHNSLKE
jgi:hypothetical protein